MKTIHNYLYVLSVFSVNSVVKILNHRELREITEVTEKYIRSIVKFLIFFLLLSALNYSCLDSIRESPRPNIIIILADDMGYSDIGYFGSEIQTPTIDALASEGLVMTQFYNAGRCCPTRASLLTGLYQHQTGVGFMNGDKGYPSYQGFLNDSCVTIAEVLKKAGYHTFISGKWHVGNDPEVWPLQKGFDRYYGFPKGGGVYFYPWRSGRNLVLGNEVIEGDSNFYSTDAFTDYAIQFIEEVKESSNPFFLYLPFIAPHFPLQAHTEDIQKYRGKYLKNWKEFRLARYNKMIEAGIIKKDFVLSPEDERVRNWEELSDIQKDEYDLRMAVYAAQVECMDRNIGKLIEKLKEWNLFDHTIIFFMSDNGGSSEALTDQDNSDVVPIGSRASWSSYHASWANLSNTPYRLYKHWVHEGGISTPLIIHYPEMIEKHMIDSQVSHIIDLMPTCIELASASYPDTLDGIPVIPCEGKSMVKIFNGQKMIPHDYLFWEHMGNKAVRWHRWKLVMQDEKRIWELYDMSCDRTELNDLSDQYPELVEKLSKVYEEWEQKVGIMPWDSIR